MELTPEQSEIVEENHNLIYGFAHSRGLDIDEWYGDLAIVLCNAVISHDPERSELSTHYYNAGDNLMKSKYRAISAAKRQPEDMLSLDYNYADAEGHFTLHDVVIPMGQESVEETLFTREKFKELYNGPYGDIVKMRSHGYTQEEIASRLGFSQQYISEILREIRKEIEDEI